MSSADPKHPTEQNSNRHPPHLRGRAIGLWYAQRHRSANADSTSSRSRLAAPQPVATIELSAHEIQRVTEVRHLFQHRQTQSHRSTKDGSSNNEDDREENFEIDDPGHAVHFESLYSSFQYFEPLNRKPEIDQILLDDLRQKQTSTLYQNLVDKRARLPIHSYRQEILNTAEQNQIFILVGETGSGISFEKFDKSLLFSPKEKRLKPLNSLSIIKFPKIKAVNVESFVLNLVELVVRRIGSLEFSIHIFFSNIGC